MKGNGAATLRCWPVNVTIGGTVHRIGPRPALDWIIPVADEDWFRIIPGMIEFGDSRLDRALLSKTITHRECLTAAHDAVGAAAGLPWWSASRIVSAIVDVPEIAGELILLGVNPAVVSFGAYVQAGYRLLLRDADKKQREKIKRDVARTPEGMSIEERMHNAQSSGGFEEMARARGLSI
jgi:hypothetical protein